MGFAEGPQLPAHPGHAARECCAVPAPSAWTLAPLIFPLPSAILSPGMLQGRAQGFLLLQ